MSAVKGVGTGAVEEVIRARDEDGPFASISDFARRVSTSKFNRKAWESLIKSGAFDQYGSRSDLLFNLDAIVAYASRVQKDISSNQADLFGGLGEAVEIPDIELETAPEQHHEREQLQWERELLGLYLSAHPLDKYDDYFAEQTVPIGSLKPEHDKKKVIIGGILSSVRMIATKNGSKMAFVRVEDKSGDGEAIIFPKTYEEVGEKLIQDAVVKVTGKISSTDRDGNSTGEAKIIADEVIFVTNEELDNYKASGKKMKALRAKPVKEVADKPKEEGSYSYIPVEEKTEKLFIHVKDPDDHSSLLAIKKIMNGYPGDNEIILVLGVDKKSALRLPFKIEPCPELITELCGIYGQECVVLK